MVQPGRAQLGHASTPGAERQAAPSRTPPSTCSSSVHRARHSPERIPLKADGPCRDVFTGHFKVLASVGRLEACACACVHMNIALNRLDKSMAAAKYAHEGVPGSALIGAG
jgi:hypothetical protein